MVLHMMLISIAWIFAKSMVNRVLPLFQEFEAQIFTLSYSKVKFRFKEELN